MQKVSVRSRDARSNLVVSTPYCENSIVAIARVAAGAGRIASFYTTLYLAAWKRVANIIPVVGRRLEAELSRRAFSDIPRELIHSVATLPELAHVCARHVFGRQRPDAVASLMYEVKARFDRGVARRLRGKDFEALVGMYAGAQESFRCVKNQGGFAVLNFVNSHPVEHNRYLFELAGLEAPHHELIPDWVVSRVEEELALADLVLVPSAFVAEQLMAHCVPSPKIVILPYGVDLKQFHPLQGRKPDADRLECLYVGHISHRKGIRILLDAARLCRDVPVHFRLIGPMVSAEVLDRLPDNVVYEGASVPNGVAEAMRRADLFLLPTIEDSFGLVVFEAMASRLPVVTTTHAGAGELIENGHDGLIVPAGDAGALADAVRRLVDEPELRVRLGDAARHKVQTQHSWEAYGASVLEAIEACR